MGRIEIKACLGTDNKTAVSFFILKSFAENPLIARDSVVSVEIMKHFKKKIRFMLKYDKQPSPGSQEMEIKDTNGFHVYAIQWNERNDLGN